ncbi:MAG: RNA-binding domain-containing protein [Candidatus Jordarchaeaceae archaeon]
MIELEIETPIYPTESREKVEKALRTIADTEYIILEKGGVNVLYGKLKGLESLSKIYKRLREQLIVESARKIMKRNIAGDTLVFYINKQAAFMGKIHFCLPKSESPMGAIKVSIRSENIEELIDWLTPKTVNGKPIEREPPNES